MEVALKVRQSGSESPCRWLRRDGVYKVKDIDSALEYMNEFGQPHNRRQCTKICDYYPDEDEAFLNFMSEKIISEQPDFLNNYLNNAEFYNWVLAEIEKRKNENINILKELSLID